MNSETSWQGAFAGVPISVVFADAKLRRTLEPLLGRIFVTTTAVVLDELQISVVRSRHYRTQLEIPGDSDRVRVFRAADGWVLHFLLGRVWLKPESGSAELAIDPGFGALPLKERQTALLMTMIWLLSCHRRYVLHAAAVALTPSCALLLAGESGNGKSTTFAALLGAGCEGIADDVSVIGEDDQQFCAWPLALGVSLAPSAVAFAGPVEAEDLTLNDGKQLVFPQRWVRSSVPLAGLVQMKLVADGPSRLDRLSAGEALLNLLPAAGGVLLDDGAASARLGALGRMAQTLQCFRLQLGRDLYGRGEMLRVMLKRGLERDHD